MKTFIVLTSIIFLGACGDKKPDVAVVKNSDVTVIKKSDAVVIKTCAFDAPAKDSRLSASKEFNVVGWAFDNQTAGSQNKVRVQFNSAEDALSKTFDAPLNIKRPDIAAAFKNAKLENTGFVVTIPAKSLMPGKYEIKILQDRPNETTVCGDRHAVVIE